MEILLGWIAKNITVLTKCEKERKKTLINGYSQASYDNSLSRVTLCENNCDLIDHIGHRIQQNDTQHNDTLFYFP